LEQGMCGAMELETVEGYQSYLDVELALENILNS
jgi:hypothetical protein